MDEEEEEEPPRPKPDKSLEERCEFPKCDCNMNKPWPQCCIKSDSYWDW